MMSGDNNRPLKPVTFRGKQQQAWGDFMLQVNGKWADFREIVEQEVNALKTKGPDYIDAFAANTKEAAHSYRLVVMPFYEQYLIDLCKFEALDILRKNEVDLHAMINDATQAKEAKREARNKKGKVRGAGRGKGKPGVARDCTPEENAAMDKSSWGSP